MSNPQGKYKSKSILVVGSLLKGLELAFFFLRALLTFINLITLVFTFCFFTTNTLIFCYLVTSEV